MDEQPKKSHNDEMPNIQSELRLAIQMIYNGNQNQAARQHPDRTEQLQGQRHRQVKAAHAYGVVQCTVIEHLGNRFR